MVASLLITPWHWGGLAALIVGFLVLDLRVVHRRGREVGMPVALGWTGFCAALALGFGLLLWWGGGRRPAMEFYTGYFLELSLSLDNILVIVLIFRAFRIPETLQHRVLFWGLAGALILRGSLIFLGVALVNRFDWLLYLLGALLLGTGVKMFWSRESAPDPEHGFLVRCARRWLPLTKELDGERFVTRSGGRWSLTPLFLALLLVESADLVFALDSVPAIFGVTRQPFIVFASNIFAILGLRSLYSVLAGALDYFRFLKPACALLLTFVGVKLLLDPHTETARWWQVEIPNGVSLLVVVGVLVAAVLASWALPARGGGGADGGRRG